MFLLITRPLYDKETHYLYHWTASLVKEAEERWTVLNLEKGKVVREIVESYLEKRNPEIVIFNGHGDQFCVVGQDGEILIQMGANTNLLRNKIVYMRACNAGKSLGPDAIEKGAKNFIGYKELFRFWTKEEGVRKPLNDDYARPFFECSNKVIHSLIKGKTAEEANNDSMQSYRKVISDLLTSQSSNSFLVPDLLSNMVHQVCL
ncbi:MAG: hypothetical protein V1656_00035 [Candidatus Jorgensenbacteria bacterium]